MSHFNPAFLDFFKSLAANNHKEWFDENRSIYEKEVKEPFKNFVQLVILQIAKKYPEFQGLEAKDCIFRINRDIRFSKDKTPYKTQVSAVVAPEGKKSKAINGVYFELSPEHVRVYGGIYELDKDDLYFVREGITENLDTFQKLYRDKTFVKIFGELLGEKNKVLPKEFQGYIDQEPLILNKQWYFYAQFPAEEVLKEDLDQTILHCFEVGRPIEQFFNQLIKR